MLSSIEQHDKWIAACIVKADKEGSKALDATPEAQEEWAVKVQSFPDQTIFGG
jgi:hypothetical protein